MVEHPIFNVKRFINYRTSMLAGNAFLLLQGKTPKY